MCAPLWVDRFSGGHTKLNLQTTCWRSAFFFLFSFWIIYYAKARHVYDEKRRMNLTRHFFALLHFQVKQPKLHRISISRKNHEKFSHFGILKNCRQFSTNHFSKVNLIQRLICSSKWNGKICFERVARRWTHRRDPARIQITTTTNNKSSNVNESNFKV